MSGGYFPTVPCQPGPACSDARGADTLSGGSPWPGFGRRALSPSVVADRLPDAAEVLVEIGAQAGGASARTVPLPPLLVGPQAPNHPGGDRRAPLERSAAPPWCTRHSPSRTGHSSRRPYPGGRRRHPATTAAIMREISSRTPGRTHEQRVAEPSNKHTHAKHNEDHRDRPPLCHGCSTTSPV